MFSFTFDSLAQTFYLSIYGDDFVIEMADANYYGQLITCKHGILEIYMCLSTMDWCVSWPVLSVVELLGDQPGLMSVN